MIRYVKISVLFILFLGLSAAPGTAAGNISTQVKVIHASTGGNHIDPGLSAIISEIQPVFRYTSFRLLSSKNMILGADQDGKVSLPGGRTLVVTPQQMQGSRIPFQIKMIKNNRAVFQTRIQLRNNSSVTIGGPRYDNGVILINIVGRAQ